MTDSMRGPWFIDESQTHIGGKETFAICYDDGTVPAPIIAVAYRGWEHQRQHAKLISAAPDLLRALEDILEALRIHAPGTALNNHQFDVLGIAAYAAIAKAKQ